MKNTRTLISSSIVSLIIIVLGMFMLCMSSAPKISFDEPLIEGGGVEQDSVGGDEGDFFSSLAEENDNMTLTENKASSSSDDDILSFLNETEQSTQSYEQSSESGDEGMEEILSLLELDDKASSESQTNSQETDWIQDLEKTEPMESTTQSGGSDLTEMAAIDELAEEVEQLENRLADKTTEVEDLRSEINEYDQKIAKYKSPSSSPGSNKTPVRTVSYYESTPSEESNYSANSEVGATYVSGDYEQSYNDALVLFQNHQYPQAIDAFFQLLQQNSRHPLADNCQYWIGECRYAQGKFYQAIAEFNKVFVYDTPDKQDDAQLMLGLAYLKLGELNSARNEFDWLVSCYASSEYVNTAHRYLGQF
jgi:TolA-binding protein